jgi:hypothetical protein
MRRLRSDFPKNALFRSSYSVSLCFLEPHDSQMRTCTTCAAISFGFAPSVRLCGVTFAMGKVMRLPLDHYAGWLVRSKEIGLINWFCQCMKVVFHVWSFSLLLSLLYYCFCSSFTLNVLLTCA